MKGDCNVELIIPDPTYGSENGDHEGFVAALRRELCRIRTDAEIREVNIGRGADLPAVLVVLLGLYFLGEKIEKNLDAWVSLAKKFSSVLRGVTRRFGSFRTCPKGASLLAIDHIVRL